jgi:hypothetical protein
MRATTACPTFCADGVYWMNEPLGLNSGSRRFQPSEAFPEFDMGYFGRTSGSGRLKSRYLSEDEKRDVIVSVIEVLKLQNPDCHVHVEVEDWTDERGVPQYTATIKSSGAAGSRRDDAK